jgi:hypothetical protein
MISRLDLALLAVRLLALYLIVQGISSVAGVVQMWKADDPNIRESAFWITVAMTLPIVFGAGLLAFSRLVAARLLPPTQVEESSPRAATVQSIAIGTFGLFLVAYAIPRLWTRVLLLEEPPWGWEEDRAFYEDPYLVGEIVSLVIGVVLFTGAGYWTRLFARFRDLGHGGGAEDAG